MKSVSASEFKAKCLSIINEIDAEGILITKRGKPVAKLVPADVPSLTAELHGKYRDEIEVLGDIVTAGRDWRAES